MDVIERGTRIAQDFIVPVETAYFVEVRRTKWVDQYKSEHLIPKQAYLDNGW
ncbi:deoxyuridine 5'-triphosphate nucleotidohydrolase [Bacillus pseudomycoides]|nr:deoxyuridine 5'-triphosphate nucleotidohydrolase [Bacillus pseudomycoides]